MSHRWSLSVATEVFWQIDSDSVAINPIQLPHHPSGTSSERRSPQRKPRLGLAGVILLGGRLCDNGFAEKKCAVARAFEPTTSDKDIKKPIPAFESAGDGSSLKD